MSPKLRGTLASLALVAALGLTACASLSDTLRDQLDASTSATESAALALSLLADQRALPAFTDTTLGDALGDLDDAAGQLIELGALTDGSGPRGEALDAISSATDAVVAARDAAAAGDDLDPAIEDVDAATERLQRLSDELQQ
jgi:hypothetical protein